MSQIPATSTDKSVAILLRLKLIRIFCGFLSSSYQKKRNSGVKKYLKIYYLRKKNNSDVRNSIYMPILHHSPVKLQRFWCGDIPFIAYQFTNGEIAMSQTQSLPAFSTAIGKIASDFISANCLPTVKAILPNRVNATLYPLPTVTALWSHFLTIDPLFSRNRLLKEFLAGTPILEDSNFVMMESSNLKVDLIPATLVEIINLQIGSFLLSVFLEEDKIYISDNEGLSVINAPTCWIAELNPAQKKARILKSKGFSFQDKILFYQKNHVFQSRARIWSDWLILWEYFAGKGNTKALLLLRHLATHGLENRVNKCNRE